ncbi:hypothetical protein [Planomonospora venezuelensis]|uniref:Uncharacterized protein n=1 Tax=Planomonospora venezuelensis TaxID=1999 RepID=A0A841DL91_PLAVE|nr:hypothetical protein [Planomonospora venezuelensis]MBB5967876.1 hypothetical protein [Planomonospora venezuelensis]GIN03276.1 hypothetical protein Pve01_49340 [Planomonospora venezuelensis]
MIHKSYHPNGSPDLRSWIAQCDNRCSNTVALIEATRAGWFIGHRANGRCYCPACIEVLAMCLISWTLVCPACGSSQLALGTDNDGTAELVLCDGECRSTYLAADGWHCACCGDPITLLDDTD